MTRKDEHLDQGRVSYVIVSPVRDEAEYLDATIQSVAAQTILPRQWVVVNDGSTDETAAILDQGAQRHEWIQPVHRSDRGYRAAGSGVMEAFYAGYEALNHDDWDYLVKLDGDLELPTDYFARCFERFEANPKLGIGGGVIRNRIGRDLELENHPGFHVRGATKIYRRRCWQDIDGLIRLPGWDTLDEVTAQMRGWHTESFREISLVQNRETGGAAGPWGNWVKNGAAAYLIGYHPLFLLLRAIRQLTRWPYGVATVGLIWGYFGATLRREPRAADPEIVRYLRQQQMARMLGRESIWR